MRDKFLLFENDDNSIYMILSNFKFNKEIKIDYTHDIKNIDDVPKYFNKGVKRFKMRYDFHSGHIIRQDEFYNYMDNLDSDFKNSNAKALEKITFSDLISDDKINIIYTGKKDDNNKIVKTNIYFIVPVSIASEKLNSNLISLDITAMNKRLNDVYKSETTNQKLLGIKPSVTNINIIDRQNKIINEYFRDIGVDYNFINDFSKSEE